ncbi:MAG: phosphotransferase, partial [Acidobacteriales bacterium]|nr:phosphotransferase [Terriglobales bacterium]
GDYSPKNMLVNEAEIFLIDFEVVHCGDPSFDTAFFLNHLFLKALRFPEHRALYLQSARNFWRSYTDGIALAQSRQLEKNTLEHLGCLLLARVDGKSPVEYITEEALKQRVRQLSQRILLEAPAELERVVAWIGCLEPQI